jgi:hypothetical protein
VRYVFADGRSFEARIVSREGIETEVEERVVGTAGEADLRRHAIDGSTGWRHAGSIPNPHASCAATLVAAIRAGVAVDGSAVLARATLTALMGRMALRSGRPARWPDPGVAAGPTPATTATI